MCPVSWIGQHKKKTSRIGREDHEHAVPAARSSSFAISPHDVGTPQHSVLQAPQVYWPGSQTGTISGHGTAIGSAARL